MGCSGSKGRAEGSVIAPTSSAPSVGPLPAASESGSSRKPTMKIFDTHTTEASSKGSGPSLHSLLSTVGSEGSSTAGGTMSLHSASSKRSAPGDLGEKLSDFDEDFEDDDEVPQRTGDERQSSERPQSLGRADQGASPLPRHKETTSGEGNFSMPPSPSGSIEVATVQKGPADTSCASAVALAEAPVSTVQVLASREGMQSVRRSRDEAVSPRILGGAKSEGTSSQASPSTPRTEATSPSAASTAMAMAMSAVPMPIFQTPVRSSVSRGGGRPGHLAFPAEAPMFVLPLAWLIAARRFPTYQNAMRSGALVPYDSLNRNSAFVVFVSHRWVNEPKRLAGLRGQAAAGCRGSGGRAGGDEDGVPDVDSTKHSTLVEGLSSILASLPREVAVFVWIDFSCVDQDNEESKRRSARSLAAYIQRSDAVFTPYAESLYAPGAGNGLGAGETRIDANWWGAQSKPEGQAPPRTASDRNSDEVSTNPLGVVCDTQWPNSYRSLDDFCSRAWCRLEVLLCAALPIREDGYRYFAARGKEDRSRDRPHFLFGEYQQRRKLPPEALGRAVDDAWANSLDPLEGVLSNPEDMEAIVHGMGPLRLAFRSAAAPLQPRGNEESRDTGGRVAGESPDTAGRGAGVQAVPRGAGHGRMGQGLIPPPIDTRMAPGGSDEVELVSAARSAAPDRLMSPAVRGSRIMAASPMRVRTAAANSALDGDNAGARVDSGMPEWLWETVSQHTLAEGDTRTQYSDGSTYIGPLKGGNVGPLKGGKRHGKGVYFFQDGSRYEGWFKEDKRHGEGTLILAGGGRYVGQWDNDLQHGQGTFYFADSSCFRGMWVQGKKKSGVFTYSSGGRYIGELQGGRRHGRGSFLYPDGSSYEGQWQDNVKHGEGTAWYASGNRYVGQWRDGKSHGEGTYYYATGARYEGQFDGGKCHGRGTYHYANGNKYEGEWKDDMKWGFGTALYHKKAEYEGHFFMDKRHGFGRMRYANAGTYEGEWASGKPHGQGTATHKDGEKYVGTYKAGLYHGEGCYWYTTGAVYEGEYRNGRVHGRGRAIFPSGDSYAGEWKDGVMSGTGVYVFKEEGASYEGDFDNGRMHGVGVYRWPHGDVYRGSWQNDRRSGRGRYEWTELGLTFDGMFQDDRRTGRGSIIFPDGSRYECQWEDDKAVDSTAEGSRSIHYRADGTECAIQGDELRNLMRRINEQRMMRPVTPTVNPDSDNGDQQPSAVAAAAGPSPASTSEAKRDA